MLTTNAEWVRRVRNALQANGYYYEPRFCLDTSSTAAIVAAAHLLGRVYVPEKTKSDNPLISTVPSPTAPPWRPFDRQLPIRWHSDFSTHTSRPELSILWIRRQDPEGPMRGDWWVASAHTVIAELRRTNEGKRLVAQLLRQGQPFGYRDTGDWRSFRIISQVGESQRLRFYGPALEDGALLCFGKVPDRTREIVARIETAADAVREVLPATTGALLIVHNGLSLHDRAPQTITGPKGCRRQAVLCFVKRLHTPL